MRIRRVFLCAAVIVAVLAAGCGPAHMDKQRQEARDRWAVSRAEMAVRMAEGCYQRGEIGRARQYVEEVLRSGAPYAPLYVLAARLEADKGDLDAARLYAQSARLIDPKSAEACYVLGTVEQALGETGRALAAFESAARLSPDQARYTLAEAEMLVAEEQPEKAVENLAAAAERMPGRAELRAALGEVLMLLGRHESAAGNLRIATRLEPQRQDLKERLALALYYSGAYAEAETLLVELADAQPEFAAGWITALRAECLVATGRPADARRLLAALAQNSRGLAPLVGLAKCDILEGRMPSARRSLEEALGRDPRHGEANALMGYVLLAEGRPAEAEPHLALALKDPHCAGRASIARLLARAQAERPAAAPPAEKSGK
ncbi:MAG: tetratricopeptide repeat protein [Planctomycetes bacterium]|nr:tetratricopeptide repeat protein [Planctomycetota bacterium]